LPVYLHHTHEMPFITPTSKVSVMYDFII